MNSIQLFQKEHIGQIRTVVINNEIYLCLKDVCKILGIVNHKNVVKRLNQKGVHSIDYLTPGGMQKTIFINESNLYKVIFQSRKPEAEAFTEWVTNEVLPSIRQTGQYISNDRIMQLEQRISTLEEAKEPFNNFSDESILIDFFKAIKSEIDCNNYYLINDKDTEYTGQLLGIETYTTIYLIGNVAYNIYQTHTKAPVRRPTLSDLFQLKQIIVPSKTHGNLTKRKVGNKNYLCYAFLKDRISNYL